MNFTRELRYGMSGEDVFYIKKILFSLGYYEKTGITSIKTKTYGGDTRAAVKYFQSKHDCEPTGIIDQLTWDWIILASTEEANDLEQNTIVDPSNLLVKIPSNISSIAANAIKQDLVKVSPVRQQICADILQFAYDLNNPPPQYPISLYIRGGNIYNKDLTVNRISLSYVSTTYPSRFPDFVTEGREEYLIAAVKANPGITGADCSGGIVGECRKWKVTSSGFDATANSLCSDTYSVAIDKSALKPGDWVGREQHIGMYVGGGYVVEWIGGAYGCQLTALNKRVVYNLMERRKQTFSAWTKFRDPKCY